MVTNILLSELVKNKNKQKKKKITKITLRKKNSEILILFWFSFSSRMWMNFIECGVLCCVVLLMAWIHFGYDDDDNDDGVGMLFAKVQQKQK